jgi:hypothetical protein
MIAALQARDGRAVGRDQVGEIGHLTLYPAEVLQFDVLLVPHFQQQGFDLGQAPRDRPQGRVERGRR